MSEEYIPARIEYAPAPRGEHRNIVDTVVLRKGENVEWFWTHDKDGSFVSGYSISHIYDYGKKD